METQELVPASQTASQDLTVWRVDYVETVPRKSGGSVLRVLPLTRREGRSLKSASGLNGSALRALRHETGLRVKQAAGEKIAGLLADPTWVVPKVTFSPGGDCVAFIFERRIPTATTKRQISPAEAVGVLIQRGLLSKELAQQLGLLQ